MNFFQTFIVSLLHLLLPSGDFSFPNKEYVENISFPVQKEQGKNTIKLSATSAMLLDVDSNMTLYSLDPDTPRNIASITKLVTSLVILQNTDLDSMYVVPKNISNITGSTNYLKAGDSISVRNLLAMSLIESSNQAAYTLAINFAGSVGRFADYMNEMAKSLGMNDSHFLNPVGYDEKGHYSTVNDLKKLTLFTLRHPTIYTISNESSKYISTQTSDFKVSATNKLLGDKIPGFLEIEGLKTGTTEKAGQCLITAAKTSSNHTLIAIILGSDNRYADARTLFEYGRSVLDKQ